jgi:hypothetical protein
MIAKVIRGVSVQRLLAYLYGPGEANEHTDPHLVAGFADPHELEPDRRADGSPDLRRLTGLFLQPLAALKGDLYSKPVWHCSVRAAPDDRMLSDAEWAEVAAGIMQRTGLAPDDDYLGVRWVAVRHAPDHIHIVATLARQDLIRPKTWNDFYRVREACHVAERRFGLRCTASADRTAAKRSTRAETEQAARRGWAETPRAALRRAVCAAAGGSGTEDEFFAQLGQAGVLVRKRYSTINPGEVTGYAVGLPHHVTKTGGTIWYGGGKLAADLTLPKLRARWVTPAQERFGARIPGVAARAVLRSRVTDAAGHARDEAGFFGQLRESGLLVRLRFSQVDPEQVTGYAVALAGYADADGTPRWSGGGRLSAELSLPRLRCRWAQGQHRTEDHYGTFRFTAEERDVLYRHAAQEAADVAERIRRNAVADPPAAADAAWAAGDTIHAAARWLGDPGLRIAADSYDRAARAPYGQIPGRTRHGDRLRATARLVACAGDGGSSFPACALLDSLAALSAAVSELRQAQGHAAQAAAARRSAEHLQVAFQAARGGAPQRPHQTRPVGRCDIASRDFPVPLQVALATNCTRDTDSRPVAAGQPPTRAGPRR